MSKDSKSTKVVLYYTTKDQLETYSQIDFPDGKTALAVFNVPVYDACTDLKVGVGGGGGTLFASGTPGVKLCTGFASLAIKSNCKQGVINYVQNDYLKYNAEYNVYNFVEGTKQTYNIVSGQGAFLGIKGGTVTVTYGELRRKVVVEYYM